MTPVNPGHDSEMVAGFSIFRAAIMLKIFRLSNENNIMGSASCSTKAGDYHQNQL
jgi:hypothetical protein